MGSRAGGRLAGALAFGAGILLYRVGGSHLGDSLSPLVFPRPEGRMAATGLYGWVRHPMYLGQILIAFGAPLTLGVRWVRWLAVPAVVVLAVRMGREEDALRARYPEYAAYAASTWRLLPFVY